ncbi:MAG: glutamate--tRNA ligase [Thermodesulfobacteriota bacterium]
MEPIITRFPPSPTGHLHIGGARTALFNWLMARHADGKFVLRIEDTDAARSTPEMTAGILEGMRWLGLDWDEGPYYQSQRTSIYQEHIERLLAEGKAYYCQCTPEEVESIREQARARGDKPKYDSRCRGKNLGPGPNRVVRFKAPQNGSTVYTDSVRGANAVDNQELDDFVLRRADGSATYQLAVVVDDATMGITHILRGDDHMSNTPKQVLLYEALGYPLPVFGHVPMILGADKKKLSKRHGAASVLEYRDQGYLPEAVVNYLVRLGWSYGDQEIFTLPELIQLFSPENLGKSACVFDPEKLEWVNAQHIKQRHPCELSQDLNAALARDGWPQADAKYLERVIPLLQPRAKTLREMADMASVFVVSESDLVRDPDLVNTFITADIQAHLNALASRLESLEEFTQPALETVLREYLEETGLKFKVLAQPIRVALTGRKASPGLFEMMEAMGQNRVVHRFRAMTEHSD